MSDVTLRATRFSMPLSHPQQQRLSRRGASYPPVDIWQCLESFSGVKTWEVCDWHLMGSDREAANPPTVHRTGPTPRNYVTLAINSAQVGKPCPNHAHFLRLLLGPSDPKLREAFLIVLDWLEIFYYDNNMYVE